MPQSDWDPMRIPWESCRGCRHGRVSWDCVAGVHWSRFLGGAPCVDRLADMYVLACETL